MEHDHFPPAEPSEQPGQALLPPPPEPVEQPDPSVMPISFRLILLDKHLGAAGAAPGAAAEQADPLLEETPEETAAIDEFLRLYEEHHAGEEEPTEATASEEGEAEEEPTANHYGPGPHKSGSPQSVHGKAGRRKSKAMAAPVKPKKSIVPPEERILEEVDDVEYDYPDEEMTEEEYYEQQERSMRPAKDRPMTKAEQQDFLAREAALRKYGIAIVINDSDEPDILETRNSAFLGRSDPHQELDLLGQQKASTRAVLTEIHTEIAGEVERLAQQYPGLAKKLKSRPRLKKDALALYAVAAPTFRQFKKHENGVLGRYRNHDVGDPVDGTLAVGIRPSHAAPAKTPGEHKAWMIEDSTRGVFRHELGHYVWYRMLKAADRKKVAKEFKEYGTSRTRQPASGKPRISRYGDTQAEEAWAEGFAYFTANEYQAGKLPPVMEEVLRAAMGVKK